MFSAFGNRTGKTSTKRIAHATALGVAILLHCGASAPSAQAAYTVTLVQQGLDVVATGSGKLDVTDLRLASSQFHRSEMVAFTGGIITGPPGVMTTDDYFLVTNGPTNFGSGGVSLPSSGSGDLAGIIDITGHLVVPLGYVSGSPVSGTATYDNSTFASLGVTPGTYVWTWGSGVDADSFTLQIGPAAVPEPASLTLLAIGLAGLGVVPRSRRRGPVRPEPAAMMPATVRAAP